jgi:hypothetical protein
MLVSREEWARLQKEWKEMGEVHDEPESGDGLVEERLFGDDETFERVMEEATRESISNDDAEGVHDEYLQACLTKIKKDTELHGRPDCYAKGTCWIHKPDPIFVLDASWSSEAGISPTGLYYLNVFVWLPDLVPNHPDHFLCTCKKTLCRNGLPHFYLDFSTELMQCIGYNSNPVARRVRGLHEDYFLLTNRFRCVKENRVDPGCGASFQGTDQHIISQLPKHARRSFPG